MEQPSVTLGKRTPLQGSIEWCFKFNDEEPVVFGTAERPESLKIDIPAEAEANIVFTSGSGNKLEIFPREAVLVETEELDQHGPSKEDQENPA